MNRRQALAGLAGILASGFAPAAIGSGILMPVRRVLVLSHYEFTIRLEDCPEDFRAEWLRSPRLGPFKEGRFTAPSPWVTIPIESSRRRVSPYTGFAVPEFDEVRLKGRPVYA